MPQAEGTSTSPTPQRRSRPAAAPRFAPTTTSTPQVRRACAAGQARSKHADCVVCRQAIFADEERCKDQTGAYYHQKCWRAQGPAKHARDPGEERKVFDKDTGRWLTESDIIAMEAMAAAKGKGEGLKPKPLPLAAGGAPAAGVPRTRIVFIAEMGALSRGEIDATMDGCVEAP